MTNFDVKDKVDNVIYFVYNLYSCCSFYFRFKIKKILTRNRVFKNKHLSQRCFILGCGPSLKKMSQDEISFLKNEVTIGVNELFRTNFLKELTPLYYFMVDNAYWNEEIDTTLNAFNYYKNKGTIFFTGIKAYKILSTHIDENKLYYLHAGYFPRRYILNRIDRSQTVSMNVVTQAILTAMYMGFKEIYLLGCDYTAFATPMDTHSYHSNDSSPKKENLGFYLKYYELTTRIHYMVANKAVRDNISIVNLTYQSLLDAYPKQRFEKVFDI